MKRLIIAVLIVFFTASTAFAGWVNGYFRSDGTYVPRHYRSSSDSNKWNNYGLPTNYLERANPYSRDWDNDGTPNYFLDMDDENDGRFDNYDRNHMEGKKNKGFV